MQIKINGQTISLAAPEPFLSILRRFIFRYIAAEGAPAENAESG